MKSPNKLAKFIADLKSGLVVSKDPFDDNFFDMEEHLAQREAEEPLLVEFFIKRAQKRAEIAMKTITKEGKR